MTEIPDHRVRFVRVDRTEAARRAFLELLEGDPPVDVGFAKNAEELLAERFGHELVDLGHECRKLGTFAARVERLDLPFEAVGHAETPFSVRRREERSDRVSLLLADAHMPPETTVLLADETEPRPLSAMPHCRPTHDSRSGASGGPSGHGALQAARRARSPGRPSAAGGARPRREPPA